MKRFDILVIGELNVDLILDNIRNEPAFEKEQIAEEMTLTLGGSSAIFAANSASLGSGVVFSGKIGKDSFGRLILDILGDTGVNTDYITIDETAKTGLTASFSRKNERMMVTYPGAMASFSLRDVPEKLFQESRHLHISSVFLQPNIKRDLAALFQTAREQGLSTSLDTQWDPSEKWELDLAGVLPYVDFFFPNESELLQLTGCRNLQEALEKLPETSCHVVVKRGKKGALLHSRDATLEVSGFAVDNIVDAIGAGDSFNTGFVHAYLGGRTMEECLAFGNLTGALSVTAAGGTEAIKSYDQVLEFGKKIGYKGL